MAPLTCYGHDVALSPMLGGGFRVWAPDPKGWRETRLHIEQEGEVFVLYERLGRRPRRPGALGMVPARRLGDAHSLAEVVRITRFHNPKTKVDSDGALQEVERA